MHGLLVGPEEISKQSKPEACDRHNFFHGGMACYGLVCTKIASPLRHQPTPVWLRISTPSHVFRVLADSTRCAAHVRHMLVRDDVWMHPSEAKIA